MGIEINFIINFKNNFFIGNKGNTVKKFLFIYFFVILSKINAFYELFANKVT